MAKEPKKTVAKVEVKPSGPVRFHSLDEQGKQEVIKRIAKGEVILVGPNSIVTENK